ncbi:retroviral pseudoprotease-like protein, partial [Monkeypox virus]
MSSKG